MGDVGDDTLDGGGADDILKVGAGSDMYHFGLDYGQDVIIEGATASEDVVELGAVIAPARSRVSDSVAHTESAYANIHSKAHKRSTRTDRSVKPQLLNQMTRT